MKIKKSIFIYLFLFLFSKGFCFNLRIDTPKIKIKIKPGQTITGVLNVENSSSKQIIVKAYLEDFTYISPYDGTKKFMPPNSLENSCAKWINFSPHEFTLPPFGRKKVSYSINVPSRVEGGYYAVLFFETSLGKLENDLERVNISLLGRIGCLFFIETENKTKKADIENISFRKNRIEADFCNEGNVILIAKGNFYVMDEKGIVRNRDKITDIYISPKDKARFSIKLPEKLSPGKYTLIISFDLEDGDILMREIDFLKDEKNNMKILEIRR